MRAHSLAPLPCLLTVLVAMSACNGKDDTGEPLVDADGDGIPEGDDCDDDDPDVGAPEPWYADTDGDGFGDPDAMQQACPGEPGLVDNFYDCDDSDPGMPLLVDQTSGSPTGSGSASDPIDSIATAIAAGPGCIVVGPGTYTGGLQVASDLILGSLEGPDSTTIDAGGSGSAIEVTDGSLSIGGFTITGGTGSTALGAQTLGGGIQAWNATGLRIEDCIVTGNQAQYGGGLFGPEKGETTIVDSSFSDNAAETTGGGFYLGSVVIEDSFFTDNQASYGGGGYLTAGSGSAADSSFSDNGATQGGGLYVADEGSFTGGRYTGNEAEKGGGVYIDEDSAFSGGEIDGNSAERGGGVDMETGASLSDSKIEDNGATTYGGGLHATGDISLARLELWGNHADSLGGGALMASGSFTISDLYCRDNVAESSGGGVYFHDVSATIAGLTLEGNSAEFGGGAALSGSEIDTHTDDSSVTDNTATVYGGGLHFDGSGSWWGGLFTDNVAPHGAGAFIDGPTTLTTVIFEANVAEGNGGGLLVNGDLLLDGGALHDNSAVEGAGLFVAASSGAELVAVELMRNTASGSGGGARVEGQLTSETCDWGTGADDNAPQDVYAGGSDYSWEGIESFECTGTTGCS